MSHWQELSINEAEALLIELDMLVLDMRDMASYLRSHYPEALHLDKNNLRWLLKSTEHDMPILIYCDHGNDSQEMAQLFNDFGFKNVYSLMGGYSAWHQTVKRPQKPLSERLAGWLDSQGFDGNNLDQRLANNETALMLAAKQNQVECCRQLIEAGASLNLVNSDGNNALWFAALADASDVVHCLLHAGIHIDQQNDNGATVLMQSASKGQMWLVSLLLRHGANVHLQTHDGFTAVEAALNPAMLKLLRQAAGQLTEPVYPWSAVPQALSA